MENARKPDGASEKLHERDEARRLRDQVGLVRVLSLCNYHRVLDRRPQSEAEHDLIPNELRRAGGRANRKEQPAGDGRKQGWEE